MARRYKEPSLRDPETGQWDRREVLHRLKGALAVLLAVIVMGGGVWFVADKIGDAWIAFRTADDYIGDGVADIEVVIPKGANVNTIAALLKEKDVVKSTKAFVDAASLRPDDAKKLQAGKYKLRTQVSGAKAFEMLLDPKNISRTFVRLSEGMRMERQFELISKTTKIPVDQFTAAAKQTDKLGLPAYAQGRPEGFFFPDTYELPEKPTALGILQMATKQYAKVAEDLDLEGRAEELGITPYEAVIVASIMEREVSRDEDRPKVARVIYNRLKEKMPLQLDSTVAYAVNSKGTIWTTENQRNVNSPYNTYLPANAGKLPPGPISSPARKSLEAALNPDDGDWLFFMPQNLDTGETVFTNTPQEHEAAVKKFHEWCNATPENKKKCS